MEQSDKFEEHLQEAKRMLAKGRTLECFFFVGHYFETLPAYRDMEKKGVALKKKFDELIEERFSNDSHLGKKLFGKIDKMVHGNSAEDSKSYGLLEFEQELYGLLADAEWTYLRTKSNTFQAMRDNGLRLDKKEFKSRLESFGADEAMLFLNADMTEEAQKQRKMDLMEQLYDVRKIIFDYIVSSPSWSEDEEKLFVDLALSPTIDSDSAQHLVSAIMLACLAVFDLQKFAALWEIYNLSSVEEVKQRALIGFLLASTRMPSGRYVEDFCQRIGCHQKKLLSMTHDVMEIQKMLVMVANSDIVAQRFQKHIFQDISGDMRDSLKQSASNFLEDDVLNEIFDINYGESDEEFGDDDFIEGLIKNLNNINLLMDTGFSSPRKYDFPFFKEVSNWFLPFDENCPYVAKVEAMKSSSSIRDILVNVLRHSGTDAYMCVCLFEKSIKHGKTSIFEKMKDIVLEMEEDTDDINSVKDCQKKGEQVLKESNFMTDILTIRQHYTGCLSKFFKFAMIRKDFFNILEDDEEENPGYAILNSPLFRGEAFDKARLHVARFATRLYAPLSAEVMLRDHKEETLETHYMKGLAYLKRGGEDNLKLAKKHFLAMLDVRPKMRVALAVLSDCYRRLGETDHFLSNFDLLWEQSASVSEKAKLKMKKDKLKVLMDANRDEEALALAYELEYNHPEEELVSAYVSYLLLKKSKSLNDESMCKALERLGSFGKKDKKLRDILAASMNFMSKDEGAFASSMGFILNMLEKGNDVQFQNNYSMGLYNLCKGDLKGAVDKFTSANLPFTLDRFQDFYEMLCKDSEWLEGFGVEDIDLKWVYNSAMSKVLEFNSKKRR